MIRPRMVTEQLRKSRLELEKLDMLREKAIKLSRNWLTRCRELISRARGMRDLDEVERELIEIIAEIKGFLSECEGKMGYLDPALRNIVSDPMQEAVEGIVLARLLTGREVPSHEDLGVGPKEYVLGVGDSVGELRRVALHLLLEGRITEAEQLAAAMEEIYEGLNLMVFPDSLVPVRRKADVARSLVEKTLSEILMLRSSGGGNEQGLQGT